MIGNKEQISINITQYKSIKGTVINGNKEGKTLVVTAGVHGCEYVGIQAVREIINEIDEKDISGRIIFIPVVNESGFYNGLKQIVAEDGKNLNRCFPGDINGTMSEKIAYIIEKELYKKADFILDIHSGDIFETMIPLVFFPVASGKKIETITRQATDRLSICYKVPSTASNGLYSYATKCNIPALLLERGSAGKWTRQEVEECKRNIYEIMDFMGIKKYNSINNPPKEIKKAFYDEASEKGFWYCYKQVGEKIKEGDILGDLIDYDGNIIKRYKSQTNGVVLYLTHILGVNKGEPLIAYGEI